MNGTGFHYIVCKKMGLLWDSFREGWGFDWRSMAICKFVITWMKSSLPERSTFLPFCLKKKIFPSNDRHKIKRKSSRMKQLCTSKSTDFLRLKPGTLKTPLTLYEKDFCVNHQSPDNSGFGSRPLVKWKHVWIFPPFSRDELKPQHFSPLHPYTHRTQRLVWVPWCDSRNRASQYQIEADRIRHYYNREGTVKS